MILDAGLVDYKAGISAWGLYSDALKTELHQSFDEGRDVKQYEDLCNAIAALPKGAEREELADVFFRIMESAPKREDYPYVEPSDLEGILAARPENRRAFGKPACADKFRKQVRGAWLGRICGCLLGKPIEGMRTPDIKELLTNSGNMPLSRYMKRVDLMKTPRLVQRWSGWCWADDLHGYAPVDDDTNYTAMAAKGIVGRYGRDFTPADVANAWIACQSRNAYCTAERRAFINFVNGIYPPQSATYKNAYREYIGAQIRADYFGYINPGDPETAANMAWRDASISHIKNGIYGEMFVAAMIAAAAVCDDVLTVIEAGLDQVPAASRLTEGVRFVMDDYKAGRTEEECFANIASRWNEFEDYGWCHTVSNAEIVTASLLYGGKDYGKSICRAVQTGFDTDCNGATVGSILGMMLGDDAIGDEWTAPICNRLETSIFGVNTVSVDEMVDVTLSHLA